MQGLFANEMSHPNRLSVRSNGERPYSTGGRRNRKTARTPWNKKSLHVLEESLGGSLDHERHRRQGVSTQALPRPCDVDEVPYLLGGRQPLAGDLMLLQLLEVRVALRNEHPGCG